MWIAAVDVDYREDGAVAAAVWFERWEAEAPARERVVSVAAVAPYEPGRFFERELPALLAVLDDAAADVVIVDGYVWLGASGDRPGLGAHLYEALGKGSAVVGVAKNRFAGAESVEVLRGGSTRPLFVTAAGIGLNEAAAAVRSMHGAHRIPTLLGRVDRLARQK